MPAFKVKLDSERMRRRLGADAGGAMTKVLETLGEAATHSIYTLMEGRLTEQQRHRLLESKAALVYGLTSDKKAYEVRLEDEELQRLEEGYGGFSIRDKMLSSPTAVFNEAVTGTRFVDVPFPHRVTPRGRGERVPEDMRGAVLAAADRAATTGKELRIFKGKPTTRQSDMKVKPSGELKTFRRISENTPADKWQHPGYEGIKAFPQTKKLIQEIAPKVTTGVIKSYLARRKTGATR